MSEKTTLIHIQTIAILIWVVGGTFVSVSTTFCNPDSQLCHQLYVGGIILLSIFAGIESLLILKIISHLPIG